MSSSFGDLFRITTFGESHGPGVGCVIDGCPPRLPLSEADIQAQLDRRRPGQSALTTPRSEGDRVRILSGVEQGVTLGTPLALFVENQDQRPGDYAEMQQAPRPSHADYTYFAKYGIRASSGGGRASARETIGRVAAGVVAERFLSHRFQIEIVAWVDAIGTERASVDPASVTRAAVDAHRVRCPDAAAATVMEARIAAARDDRDSLGGIVACACRGLPPGWGEPVFDKLEARLAQAMLSIPATKGFEVGSGFEGTRMRGSEHNDAFIARAKGRLGTATNRSGGIQGGLSNGEPVVFRVAFKPTATIGKPQQTVAYDGTPMTLEARGRHDPCVLPRAVPIVEAMAALTLADLALAQLAREGAAPRPE